MSGNPDESQSLAGYLSESNTDGTGFAILVIYSVSGHSFDTGSVIASH
jgi:hypothetical protein